MYVWNLHFAASTASCHSHSPLGLHPVAHAALLFMSSHIMQAVPCCSPQFSGPVPAAFGGMPNLWRVRLAYNHFTGTLPATWA